MCGLTGFVNYGKAKRKYNKELLLKSLGIMASTRGTHATGIAYNYIGLNVRKSATAAEHFDFSIPKNVKAVMLHTRHTTQGTEKDNFNNHPFLGTVNGLQVALAHNGVLDNDFELKTEESLPDTVIKTDSFVMLQLMEKYGNVKDAAERVSGMFTFTTLDENDVLTIVKNDSPMYFVDIPSMGTFVYGSTESIVHEALKFQGLHLLDRKQIHMKPGDIWTIYPNGTTELSSFKVKESTVWNWKKAAASGSRWDWDYDMEMEDLRWDLYDQGCNDDEVDMMLEYYKIEDLQYAVERFQVESYLLEVYRSMHRVEPKTAIAIK